MNKGADQQEIIRWMYKTQPLSVLKLWGRAMAKINWDAESKLIWSTLNVEDFVQSRATPEDIILITEKLEENYNEGKIFMTVYNDTPQSSIAIIKFSNLETSQKIAQKINATFKRGCWEIKLDNPNIFEVGQNIAEKIKEFLAK